MLIQRLCCQQEVGVELGIDKLLVGQRVTSIGKWAAITSTNLWAAHRRAMAS